MSTHQARMATLPDPHGLACRTCESPERTPCVDGQGRALRHPHRRRCLDALGAPHALDQLRELTLCRCPESVRARGEHVWPCVAEYREDVETLAWVLAK